MSSEYYSSYDVAAAERARIAAERERMLNEQRRKEEQRLAEIAAGRERDALASRFKDVNGEWRRELLKDRLEAIKTTVLALGDERLIKRCESMNDATADLAEFEKYVEDIENTARMLPSKERIDNVEERENIQRDKVTLRASMPVANNPFISQLNALLVRTLAVSALATNSAVVFDAAQALSDSINNAKHIDNTAMATRVLEALISRVAKLERDFAQIHDAAVVRDYVMHTVSEVLEEFDYEPIMGPSPEQDLNATAIAAFVTPEGEVVEAKIAAGKHARFDFKARNNESPQGELVEKCSTWCTDLENIRAKLAVRGVFVHKRSRVVPGEKSIAVTSLPLPSEVRQQSRESRGKHGKSLKMEK